MDPIRCAKEGDVDFFMNAKLKIIQNSRDKSANSVLSLAANGGHLDCCQVIYKRCPELLHKANKDQATALHNTIESVNQYIEVVKFLIYAPAKAEDNEMGEQNIAADSKLLRMVDHNQRTALHYATTAGHLHIAQLLIEADPEPDPRKKLLLMVDKEGCTALHHAVRKKFVEIAKMLIDADSSKELLLMVDKEGRTALHHAVTEDFVEIAKMLIDADSRKQLLLIVDKEGRTALHHVVRRGFVNIAKMLIDADVSKQLLLMVDKEGRTALHHAVREGFVEIAKLLIDADSSKQLLLMVDNEGRTALHHVMRKGYANLAKMLIDADSTKQLLLMVDNEGRTALHHAIREGFVEIAKMLIDGDSSNQLLTMVDGQYKETALHIAAQKGCLQSAKLLIDADPSRKLLMMTDTLMCTALHTAAAKGDPSIVQLLIDADPSKNLLMMVDNQNRTALHHATGTNSVEVAKVLIAADPSKKLLGMVANENITALHVAAINGYTMSADFLVKADPSNNLLKMVDSHKRTALHHAVLGDFANVAKLLIDADPSSQILMMVDDQGCTALHHAVTRGSSIAKLLIDADSSKKLLMMVDADNNTALHQALAARNLDLAKLIINKAGSEGKELVRMANNKDETAIPLAMEKNLLEFVDLLLDAFPDDALEQALSCNRTSADFGRLYNVPRALLASVAHKENLHTLSNTIEKWPECLEWVDGERQNILHLASKSEQESVVKFILGLTSIPTKVLNMQDSNGNTPLHIATSKGNTTIILSLLYDNRVDKMILNKHGKSALDAINFDYDKRRAGVYGLTDKLDEKDLKNRSDYDLLVGALISTLSFTAGITVPGGYFSEGPNQGSAVLHKKISFNVFVISNAIAMVLSLSAVLSHFCTRRLIKEESIKYQLKVASLCTIGSIFAMMVAFMTGSYTVLDVSHKLALSVCVICGCFFGIAFPAMWRMIKEQGQRQPCRSLDIFHVDTPFELFNM